MKDRLSELQAISASRSDVDIRKSAAAFPHSLKKCHEEPLQKHGTDPEMKAIFNEANNIRHDIHLILLDVKHFEEQNSHAWNEQQNFILDTNSIAANIKSRAKDVLARLRTMDMRASELEKSHGIRSALSRIARTQYAGLSSSFRDVMMEYNKAEMSHREMCKMFIQRQMEIVGREVTGEEIEEMLINDQWNIFSEGLVTEGKTIQSALSQIENRHTELLELESRIRSIHEVFLDMAMLVEEQNNMIDYIQTNVQKTDADIKSVLDKLVKAEKYDKSNPFKKLFFRKR
ncbi:syntaxin-11-like isoform 1-T3 [Clarias gariepinus]|uniref:syntaxin-11-like n=1 Tax=Clarias gariepinus TaxID=13013 RepID=UPI00234C2A6E|nr:syntaxin-11-like [Clarias gariepinus]XP_053344441.1 syntaxin-11-like [Clarias gariepinus]XP_053344442.1 syntaxin-11-like [Clarias gariepinus]